MFAVEDNSEVSIKQYLDVLRRRWFWLLVAPVALVAFTLVTDVRATPVYTASAQMLLQANRSETLLNPNASPSDPGRALQNELNVVRSGAIKEAVRKAYGKPIAIRASAGGDDDVFLISASAPTGRLAAERANVYARTYQTARLNALLDDVISAKKIVQQQINDFQKQVDAIDAPLADLDRQILATNPNDPRYAVLVNQRTQKKAATDAERNTAQNNLDEYQKRLQQLQLTERLNTTGGVQILNPANVPSTPVSPTVIRDVLQALAIGIFLGIAAAFIRDQLDDSMRTKEDLERAVKDLPTIGLVPFDPTWRDPAAARLVTATDPRSVIAESYRGLRTAIQYAALDRPLKIIQVTSAGAGEGKTTLLANLAMSFAQAGKRVAVVGCDLRRPRLAKYMQVDGQIGFTSVVLGDVSLEDAMQRSPLHQNLDVLAAGPRPPNPSELLSIDRASDIITALGERYSVVFVDCPPVLPVTDALVLSRCVDGTIFLATANKTTRRTARHAIDLLRQVSSPLLGTVLNGVAAEDSYGSFYEYYGYTSPSRFPLIGRFLRPRRSDDPSLDRNEPPVEAKPRLRNESEQDDGTEADDHDLGPSTKNSPR
jgi:capsular exopolysaccharide synthesis family protein